MANTASSAAGVSPNWGDTINQLLASGTQYGLNQNLQNDLFGSAIDALQQFAGTVDAQKYPDLVNYINSNIQLAQQGKINPAQALAAVQQKSNMYGVKVPSNFTDAVNNTLAQEAQVAKQGYTPVERAAIQQALNGVISQQKGEQAAIAANQQARGQYGGGQQIDQQQTDLQGMINNASAVGNQVEANAYNRALAALQAEGNLGLSAGQQSFSQNSAIATAQDAINSLNTQLQQQTNLQNAQNQQAATLQQSAQQQQRDLANQQADLALNQQKEGAANQNVQNLQGQENIAGGAIKQAGADAAGMLPPVYQQTQVGQGTTLTNALGPNSPIGSAIGGLVNTGVNAFENWLNNAPSSQVNQLGTSASNDISSLGSNLGPGYGSVNNFNYGSLDQSNMNALSSQSANGFCGGGSVHGPGTETSDSIPVFLSNHEFVINAKSAQKYKPLVEAINDDDEDGVLQSLMTLLPDEDEDKEMVLVEPKNGKPVDGQKALAQALRALASVGHQGD